MRWSPLPLACSLVLAGTADIAADTPLRPGEMRQAMGLKLGAWKTKSRLLDLQVEQAAGGDPAEVERATAKFRALLGKDLIQRQCLRDHPDRMSLPGLHPPPGCDHSRIEVWNGRFAVTSICKDPGSDGSFEVTFEGTYTPKLMTIRSHATASSNGVRFRIKLDAESRFTGKCDSIPTIRTPPMKGH